MMSYKENLDFKPQTGNKFKYPITELEYNEFNDYCNQCYSALNKLTVQSQIIITTLYNFSSNDLPVIFKDSDRSLLIKWYVQASYGMICLIKNIWYPFLARMQDSDNEYFRTDIFNSINELITITKEDLAKKIILPLTLNSSIQAGKMFEKFYQTYNELALHIFALNDYETAKEQAEANNNKEE